MLCPSTIQLRELLDHWNIKKKQTNKTNYLESIDRDRILTGSFDKTAKLWDARINSDECLVSFWGHDAEVVVVKFSPTQSCRIATGSMDTTAKIFNIISGQVIGTLKGHSGEIISLQYNDDGNQIITGSFDGTICIWDTRTFE